MKMILVLTILASVTATGCQNSKTSGSGDPDVSQTEASSRKDIDPQDSSSDDIKSGDSKSEDIQ